MSDHEPGYPEAWAPHYAAQMDEIERGDVEFYVDRARAADGPVLELACGTGRIYLELLRAGVDADGFDASAGALNVLRERAAAPGLDPSVWRADMRTFDADRAYDLAICPFNSLQHLHGIDDLLEAFAAVHDALAPGGRFVFDVFVPDFEVICGTYGEWETSEVELGGETYEHRSKSQLVDEVAQLVAVDLEVTAPDGEVAAAAGHETKLLPKREVELLVRASPFEGWTVTGDFTDEPLADGHSIQVWELRRRD